MNKSDDFLKEMGKRILNARKSQNLSQEKLAELTGLSPQTISTAELGIKALRPENLLAISQALNLTTDYILTGQITDSSFAPLCEKLKNLSSKQINSILRIIDIYLDVDTEK